MKIFIAGARKIDYLSGEVLKELKIIENNDKIFIGDAEGVDKTIQTFLKNKNYKMKPIFFSIVLTTSLSLAQTAGKEDYKNPFKGPVSSVRIITYKALDKGGGNYDKGEVEKGMENLLISYDKKGNNVEEWNERDKHGNVIRTIVKRNGKLEEVRVHILEYHKNSEILKKDTCYYTSNW